MTADQITDPAAELLRLIKHLKTVGGKNNSSIANALSDDLGMSPDSVEYLEVTAAVLTRVHGVIRLADRVTDPHFDKEMKSRVGSVARALAEAFYPTASNATCLNRRAQNFSDQNAAALLFFSQTARKLRPLRLLSEVERTDALHQIAETKKAVSDDGSLQEWEKTFLLSGLDGVERVLKHLIYFGHDEAITRLLKLQGAVAIVESKQPQDRPKRPGTLATLHVLALIVHALMIPVDAKDAIHFYEDEVPKAIIDFVERHKEPLKLPAPSPDIVVPAEQEDPTPPKNKEGDGNHSASQ